MIRWDNKNISLGEANITYINPNFEDWVTEQWQIMKSMNMDPDFMEMQLANMKAHWNDYNPDKQQSWQLNKDTYESKEVNWPPSIV